MVRRPTISNRAAVLHMLLSKDFEAFVEKAWMWIESEQPVSWNWHIDAILHVLDEVRRGNIRRLLVTMPPRNGKTNLITVIFVAWCLGQDPTMNFVCVSYANDLSAKFGRRCLSIMQSSWYRELFPGTIISNKRSAADDFETTKGGGRLATSVTGTLTGRGGDIIILDDVIKPDEAFSETVRNTVNEWYRSTLTSRLNDKRRGAIICVMQRLHQFDLAGLMIESGLWRHLKLAAIATEDERIPLTWGREFARKAGEVLHPERESLADLEHLRAEMGTNVFTAQYQQMPVPADGLIFKRHWLQSYDPSTLDRERRGGVILQSWDTGNKTGENNAWSVCITALYRNGLIYILDICRVRLEMPELVRKAVELAQQYRPDHLFIEDKASGEGLILFLRKELNRSLWPRPCTPTTDKVTRAEGISPIIENKRLFVPTEATWLGEFKSELLGFPNVRFMDQVDALTQMLEWVRDEDARPKPIQNAGPEEMFDGGSDRQEPNLPDDYDPWSGL